MSLCMSLLDKPVYFFHLKADLPYERNKIKEYYKNRRWLEKNYSDNFDKYNFQIHDYNTEAKDLIRKFLKECPPTMDWITGHGDLVHPETFDVWDYRYFVITDKNMAMKFRLYSSIFKFEFWEP